MSVYLATSSHVLSIHFSPTVYIYTYILYLPKSTYTYVPSVYFCNYLFYRHVSTSIDMYL